MDVNKANQILRVAKMYYEQHLPQQEIAQIEEISKSTVSRLLKRAEELGYIKVKVVQPFYSTADLESGIRNKYGIKKVTVIPNLIDNKEALLRDLSVSLLKDLEKLVQNGDTISVSWGNMMMNLAQEAENFDQINKEDIKVVQLTGGASSVVNRRDPAQIVRAFGNLFDSEAYQICAPTFLDNKQTALALKEDSQIKDVLDLAKNSNIAIFSAGKMKDNKLLYQLGCLSNEDIQKLKDNKAIGDICTHFLNKEGEIVDEEIDNRSISISLDDLQKIPEKLLIVQGKEKAEIVKTILEKGLVDRLYLDEDLAKVVLKN